MADVSPGCGLHPLEQEELRRRALPSLMAELMNDIEVSLDLTAADVLGDVALLNATSDEESATLLAEADLSRTQRERLQRHLREQGAPPRLIEKTLAAQAGRRFAPRPNRGTPPTFSRAFLGLAVECDWTVAKAADALSLLLHWTETLGPGKLPLAEAGLQWAFASPIEGEFAGDEPLLGWKVVSEWKPDVAAWHPLMLEWEAGGRSLASVAAKMAGPCPASVPEQAPPADEGPRPHGDRRRCKGHPGWLEADTGPEVDFCPYCLTKDPEAQARVFAAWRLAFAETKKGKLPAVDAVVSASRERGEPTNAKTIRAWREKHEEILNRLWGLPKEERTALVEDTP